MEVVEIKGGVAVLLSEHFGDSISFEFVTEEGPLVTEPGHDLDTFLTLLLERCGGGGLRGGVRCWYTARIDCCLLLLQWE